MFTDDVTLGLFGMHTADTDDDFKPGFKLTVDQYSSLHLNIVSHFLHPEIVFPLLDIIHNKDRMDLEPFHQNTHFVREHLNIAIEMTQISPDQDLFCSAISSEHRAHSYPTRVFLVAN
jgi:hypothetical protein